MPSPSPTPGPIPDLNELVALFYHEPQELGVFEQVDEQEVPEPFHQLLAHHAHMTVTVEAFHKTPVDVQVLSTRREGMMYARKILLTRQTDGAVVQFGLVQLNFNYLAPEVRDEIALEQTPLGRVLIRRNVLREVQLVGLFRIEPGPDLQRHLGTREGEVVYGRTALIYCDGQPAVELLEIVTPS
ncbi:hypothetical protein Psta_0176 [Pirellula staleyi DSM 6068]|uniref:Uncharacterized protein n=1 Tax=Pirellula staleyi (strain ATCC 27377 / DSM 6068 / ICPB 4128) TaxID=530564 RepID=D2R187_PIRSD|nr:hypothetical protein [Pirellula staleyi]ADB14872.1 hypothetical protein Psta_0176 [Pirellula staleyi DSM 6068]